MNLRSAAYWLLLVSCTLAWGGCAQPFFQRQATSFLPEPGPKQARSEKAEGRISLARLTERSGQREQAERMYQKLIERDPSDPLPFHRLAVMAAHDKKWRVAEQYFNQAYAIDASSAELLSDMGYFYYLQNRIPEAEKILRQALVLDAADRAANNNLALVLGEQQRYDECLTAFRHAGSEAEAQANLAFVLSQQGRYDQSLEAYSQALSLDKKLRPAALAMLQLAKAKPAQPVNQPNNPAQIATDQRPSPQPTREAAAVAQPVAAAIVPSRQHSPAPQDNMAMIVDDGDSWPSAQPIHEDRVARADLQRAPMVNDPRNHPMAPAVNDASPMHGLRQESARPVMARQAPPQSQPQVSRPLADAEPAAGPLRRQWHETGPTGPGYSPQTANGEPAVVRRSIDPLPSTTQDIVISDSPVRQPPRAPMVSTTPAVGASNNKAAKRTAPIHDRQVVLANQVQVPKPVVSQPPKAAKTLKAAQAPVKQANVVPRPAGNAAPKLTTSEAPRPKPETVVPEISFDGPARDISKIQAPQTAAKLNRLGIEP